MKGKTYTFFIASTPGKLKKAYRTRLRTAWHSRPGYPLAESRLSPQLAPIPRMLWKSAITRAPA